MRGGGVFAFYLVKECKEGKRDEESKWDFPQDPSERRERGSRQWERRNTGTNTRGGKMDGFSCAWVYFFPTLEITQLSLNGL